MNKLFVGFAIVMALGMIGENGKRSQKHFTIGFTVCVIAAVILTIL